MNENLDTTKHGAQGRSCAENEVQAEPKEGAGNGAGESRGAAAECGGVEEWRQVIGNSDYDVSSMGRVRRSWSAPLCNATKPGRILGDRRDGSSGYMRVSLRNKRGIDRRQVHRLVARSFLPGFEPGRHVNHKNGIKSDNRIENLEWVSPRDNVLHAWRTGLCAPNMGEDHGMHILTEREVVIALNLLCAGVHGRTIAAAFGVREATISAIKLGHTWRSVSKTAATTKG